MLNKRISHYLTYFATKITMMNKLVKGRSTIFEMEDIDFDVDIPEGVFTKLYLER